MPSTTFYIDTITGRQVICADQSPLQVNIFDLERENFIAGDNMVTFYGSAPGRYIALEAFYDPDLLPVMTAALSWYADQVNYPVDQLTVRDPRSQQPAPALRIVR